MPDPAPSPVRLHPHRGFGWGVYGTLTAFVLVLVVLGTTSYVLSARYVMAAVTAVAGLALAGFLAVLTHALVVPALTVDASGIRGRTPRGTRVDVDWDEVTVDVDADRPGRIRLVLGAETVPVDPRSWVGVTDLVVLVAGTPQARDRLTPAALREWMRLLGVPEP